MHCRSIREHEYHQIDQRIRREIAQEDFWRIAVPFCDSDDLIEHMSATRPPTVSERGLFSRERGIHSRERGVPSRERSGVSRERSGLSRERSVPSRERSVTFSRCESFDTNSSMSSFEYTPSTPTAADKSHTPALERRGFLEELVDQGVECLVAISTIVDAAAVAAAITRNEKPCLPEVVRPGTTRAPKYLRIVMLAKNGLGFRGLHQIVQGMQQNGKLEVLHCIVNQVGEVSYASASVAGIQTPPQGSWNPGLMSPHSPTSSSSCGASQ
jgi:hypothetical protein